MRIFLCQSIGLFSTFVFIGLRPIVAFGPSDLFAQLAKTDKESKLLSEINQKFSKNKEINQNDAERLADYLLTKHGNTAFIQSVLNEASKYEKKLPKTLQLPNAFINANTVLEQFELFCKEMTKNLKNGAAAVKEDCLKLLPLVVFIGLLNPFVAQPGGLGFISLHQCKSLNKIFDVFFVRYKKEWGNQKEIEAKAQKKLIEYAEFFWNEVKAKNETTETTTGSSDGGQKMLIGNAQKKIKDLLSYLSSRFISTP